MAHGCTYCTDDFHCEKFTDEKHTSWCYGENYPCKDRRISNGDRIRAMSDEELARLFCFNTACAVCKAKELCHNGHNGWLEWMRQEGE